MTNLKIDPALWQMGKTLLFMKDECFSLLEAARAAKVEESTLVLQSFFKAELQRFAWGALREGVVLAQVRGRATRLPCQACQATGRQTRTLCLPAAGV
eukprot:SAG22_NODE_4431_length_1271_cov_1.898464_2_plen_98_part_00